MIWGLKYEERLEKQDVFVWHEWYAWYPVRIPDGRWVWRERIERKKKEFWEYWSYRMKTQ